MGAEYFGKSALVEKRKLQLNQLVLLKTSNQTHRDVQLKNDVTDTKPVWAKAAARLSRLLVLLLDQVIKELRGEKPKSQQAPVHGHCTQKIKLTAETSVWRPATLFFRSSP